MHVVGGLHLVESLLAFDLVDGIERWMHPVVLGTGRRVFGSGTIPAASCRSEPVVHPTGTLQLADARVGVPTYGDMGAEPPI